MAQYSLTTSSNKFKTVYGKLSENAFNSDNLLAARIKKNFKFVGKEKKIDVPTSFAGGVGSRLLPTANPTGSALATITAKKVYSVCEIEREAMKASSSDEGAFIDMTKNAVKNAVDSYNRNASRILFGSGDGKLGTTSGSSSGTAADPVITIIASSWNEAHWEEKDYVNVNSLASVFEIVSVVASTRVVTLTRISGSDDLTALGAGTHSVYMQNSKDSDPQGLRGVLSATSSTKYGVTIARRWQAYQALATGVGVSSDFLNMMMLGVHKQCGKSPNLIVTSYNQYKRILNFNEDFKQYNIDPRVKELKGKISFSGIEFLSVTGKPVGIFYDRFAQDDEIFFLNDDFIEAFHRPSFGWFDEDGTVFMRTTEDAYNARYGGYYENYIPPSFHGYASGMTTT